MTAIADIVQGPVTVYYAPVGEAEPADSVAYGAAWGGNWVAVGRTEEPLTVAYDVTTHESESQQDTLPLKETKVSERVALETLLKEITADNLQLTLGGTVTPTSAGAGQVGKEVLEGGGEFKMDERAWGFEGRYTDDAGADFPIRFFVRRATSVINGSLTWAKDSDVGIPLKVNVLQPTDTAKAWHYERVTEAATS